MKSRLPPSSPDILLVDKPSGWTSHDVVAWYRKKLGIKKIGHTGTLDPLATGLLILLIGDATKRQSQFQKLDKVYQVTALLGFTSDTYDLDGQVHPVAQVILRNSTSGNLNTPPLNQAPLRRQGGGVPPLLSKRGSGGVIPNKSLNLSLPRVRLTPAQVNQALSKFRGPITQTVPPFSAVKRRGQKLYHLARQGQIRPEDLPRRRVEIYDLQLLSLETQPLSSLQLPRFVSTSTSGVNKSPLPVPQPSDFHHHNRSHPRENGTSQTAPFSNRPSIPGTGLKLSEKTADFRSRNDANHGIFLTLQIHCSSGTYIRSLVHDLGQVLKTGALVTHLRRNRVGEYRVENAVKIS
jgi:tRNA pseudouridine55 synthase